MLDHGTPAPSWPDTRLVDECLKGQEDAWSTLVDKYKNLIYGVILKYRTSSEEAADLFQAVWLDAYNDLHKLRKKEALKSWLISLTTHKCYHWKKKQKRQALHETGDVGGGA